MYTLLENTTNDVCVKWKDKKENRKQSGVRLIVSGLFACLVFIVRRIEQDIFYTAIQNKAKRIERLGADGFSMLHSMQRVGGHAFLVDQMVFCNPLAE